MDLSHRQLLPIMLGVMGIVLAASQYYSFPQTNYTPAGNPNAGSLQLQLSSTQSTTETVAELTEVVAELVEVDPVSEFIDGNTPIEPTQKQEVIAEEPAESIAQDDADAGLGGAQQVAPSYIQQLILHLYRYQVYPQSAKRRNITGRVVLQLHIDAQGQLLKHQLISSSGYGVLDKAAETMLKRANPLPRPELSTGQAYLTLAIPIMFTLQ